MAEQRRVEESTDSGIICTVASSISRSVFRFSARLRLGGAVGRRVVLWSRLGYWARSSTSGVMSATDVTQPPAKRQRSPVGFRDLPRDLTNAVSQARACIAIEFCRNNEFVAIDICWSRVPHSMILNMFGGADLRQARLVITICITRMTLVLYKMKTLSLLLTAMERGPFYEYSDLSIC